MRCTTQLLLLSRTHHYNKIKSSTLQPLTKWTQKRGYARRRLEFLTEEEEGDFEMPFHIYEDKKQKKYRMEKEKEEYKKHLEKYFSKASEEEKRRALELEEYYKKIEEEEKMHAEKERKREEETDIEFFKYADQKMQENLIARFAQTNSIIWTRRAEEKLWELYKSNPQYWNPTRLANLFKASPLRVRISLWHSKLIEQAKAANFEIDDRVEREFEKLNFLRDQGLVRDIPNDLPPIPDEIGSPQRAGKMWYFIDGNIKSDELLKFIRRQGRYYRESPKIPKKEIPPVVYFPLLPLSPYSIPQVYPGKYHNKYIIWDISKCYDLYNRPIVVRECDGRWRTGNWEERRWAEDFRKTIRYPYPIPFIKPDETQRDRTHPDHRPPENYVVHFDINPRI